MNSNLFSSENIKDFWFLNCPECAFKTKMETMFKSHAYQNHPTSSIFFGRGKYFSFCAHKFGGINLKNDLFREEFMEYK